MYLQKVLKFCLIKLRYYCCNSQVLLLPKMRQCKLFGWIFYFCIALVLFQGVLVEVALSASLNIAAMEGKPGLNIVPKQLLRVHEALLIVAALV